MKKVKVWPDNSIAGRIRLLANQYGGYKHLAEVCMVSERSISKWANEVYEPTYFALVALCEGTGCDANWLLGVHDQ